MILRGVKVEYNIWNITGRADSHHNRIYKFSSNLKLFVLKAADAQLNQFATKIITVVLD